MLHKKYHNWRQVFLYYYTLWTLPYSHFDQWSLEVNQCLSFYSTEFYGNHVMHLSTPIQLYMVVRGNSCRCSWRVTQWALAASQEYMGMQSFEFDKMRNRAANQIIVLASRGQLLDNDHNTPLVLCQTATSKLSLRSRTKFFKMFMFSARIIVKDVFNNNSTF